MDGFLFVEVYDFYVIIYSLQELSNQNVKPLWSSSFQKFLQWNLFSCRETLILNIVSKWISS